MAINKDGFTSLSPKEYAKQALIIKNNYEGKNWFPEVKKQLGIPKWDGVEYKFLSTGKGKIGKKSLEQVRQSKRESGSKRNIALSKANKLIGKILTKTGQNKASVIMTLGSSRNADHILEVQTFGPALEQLDQELKSKAITKDEYKKRLAVLKKYKIGDHPDNIQNLHWAKNQEKMKTVEAKNKALKNMEIKNPSLRNQTPKMAALLNSVLKSKNKTNNMSGIKTYLLQNGAKFTPRNNGNGKNGNRFSGSRDVIGHELPGGLKNLDDLWESKIFGSQFGPPMRGV
tara:strand:+ start:196 stop:1053 length:858 start_codon:yes stop_codon:yes gene_type:complete